MVVRAVVFSAPEIAPELREFAEPVLESGSVLLETIASEVCGTDVHLFHGRLEGVPYPIIPGHVSVGRVLRVQGDVQDVEGEQIQVGEVVTVVVGQYTDHGPVEINPHTELNRPHLQVRGCWGSDFGHLYRAVHTVARHAERFPWRSMINGQYSLDDATKALQATERQESIKALILPNGPMR